MSKGARRYSGARMDVMRGGRFGFTQRTVWRPESGYHDACPGTISNFAQVLGVKPRELLKAKLQGDRNCDSRHRAHPRRRDR
jgi:hypothetical protein